METVLKTNFMEYLLIKLYEYDKSGIMDYNLLKLFQDDFKDFIIIIFKRVYILSEL
jgi:hypothetical protein